MNMRIGIMNRLIHKVLRAGRARDRQAAVEMDMLLRQEDVRILRGKIQWEGDLNESRLSRVKAIR